MVSYITLLSLSYQILLALNSVTLKCCGLLQEQFDMHKGMNEWRRNPTYVPAVLLNLMRMQDKSESFENKLSRAVQGTACVAGILQHYASDQKRKDSEIPLCFNNLAGEATSINHA